MVKVGIRFGRDTYKLAVRPSLLGAACLLMEATAVVTSSWVMRGEDETKEESWSSFAMSDRYRQMGLFGTLLSFHK